jgi:hypothetical protein
MCTPGSRGGNITQKPSETIGKPVRRLGSNPKTLPVGNVAVKTGDWLLIIGVLGLKIIGFPSRVASSSPPIEGGRVSFAN